MIADLYYSVLNIINMEQEKNKIPAYKIFDLSGPASCDLSFDGYGGSVVSLVLVSAGQVTLTEFVPAFQQPRQFIIPGNTFFCGKHNFRSHLEAAGGADGYVIQFDQSVLSRARANHHTCNAAFYRMTSNPFVQHIDDQEMVKFQLAAKLLMEERRANPGGNSGLIPCIIDLLYMLLTKNIPEGVMLENSTTTVSHKFYGLLEEQFKTERKVAAYAKKLCVTASYLNRIVKQDTGHPASYHIRKRVTTEALRQARHPDASVKETAYLLGFCDTAHFSKYFKKATGTNFSSFRRTYKNSPAAA